MLVDCALQVASAMKTALTAKTEIVGAKDRTCVKHVSVIVDESNVYLMRLYCFDLFVFPSVIWRCHFGNRKGIRPVEILFRESPRDWFAFVRFSLSWRGSSCRN